MEDGGKDGKIKRKMRAILEGEKGNKEGMCEERGR